LRRQHRGWALDEEGDDDEDEEEEENDDRFDDTDKNSY